MARGEKGPRVTEKCENEGRERGESDILRNTSGFRNGALCGRMGTGRKNERKAKKEGCNQTMAFVLFSQAGKRD